MVAPVTRRRTAWGLVVLVLTAFCFYALSPVKTGCSLSSEPYGSSYSPHDAGQSSGPTGCGDQRLRFLTWVG
ncbi:hypothetical protein AB0436_23250 [Streptomyces sp. NPDC051322]|uniref:hypothetical protein n=1 Tax=Streptomyces sp. NPDC051322 TaxID=3154645 RepID=UPI00344F34E2